MYYNNRKNNATNPYVIQNAFNLYNANNYGKNPDSALFNLILNQNTKQSNPYNPGYSPFQSNQNTQVANQNKNYSPYVKVLHGDYVTMEKNPLFVQGIKEWQNMLKNQNAAKYNNFNNNVQSPSPQSNYPYNTNQFVNNVQQPVSQSYYYNTSNYRNNTQQSNPQPNYPYNTSNYRNNTSTQSTGSQSSYSSYNTNQYTSANQPSTTSTSSISNYNSSNARIYSNTSNTWQEKQPEVEAYKQKRAKIWQDSLAHKSYEAKIDKEATKLQKEKFDKDTQDGIAFITNGFIQGLDPVSDNVFRAATYNYANNDQPFGSYNNSNLVRASQIAKGIIDWEKQNGYDNILKEKEKESEPKAPRRLNLANEKTTAINEAYAQLRNNQTIEEQITFRNMKRQLTRLGFQGDTQSLPDNIAYLTRITNNLIQTNQNNLMQQATNYYNTSNISSQQSNSFISYSVPGTNQTVPIPQSIAMQGTSAIQRYVAMKFDIRKAIT